MSEHRTDSWIMEHSLMKTILLVEAGAGVVVVDVTDGIDGRIIALASRSESGGGCIKAQRVRIRTDAPQKPLPPWVDPFAEFCGSHL